MTQVRVSRFCVCHNSSDGCAVTQSPGLMHFYSVAQHTWRLEIVCLRVCILRARDRGVNLEMTVYGYTYVQMYMHVYVHIYMHIYKYEYK